MYSLFDFIKFIERLEEKKIYYKLNKVRDYSIMLEVVVPGQRWEIEFNTYGDPSHCEIEIEKFKSDGKIYGKEELDVLFCDSLD